MPLRAVLILGRIDNALASRSHNWEKSPKTYDGVGFLGYSRGHFPELSKEFGLGEGNRICLAKPCSKEMD